MAKIFISYSRKNREAMRTVVDELSDTFSAEGIFYDTQNTGGKPWWDNILEQIQDASVFVYLVSNESLASYACRAEYLEAMRLGKHIVPVDIADDVDLAYTDPPLAFILRKVHRLKHRRMNGVIKSITQGLNNSNARYYREQIQSFNMADVAGEHVNIGGQTTYNITYVVERDAAPIQEPAPGYAPSPTLKSKQLDASSNNFLPLFQWIEIHSRGYSISKYPVTNAQFAVFKSIGGYQIRKYWLESGWKAKTDNSWKAPRYWHDPKWNGSNQPVVGVSWYEAVAFANWVSVRTNANIKLPTESQWQYAAQGDDDRLYPWGWNWNADRCNSSAGVASFNRTTEVNQYERNGVSPFGVVDMLGNVWEWCLDWDAKKKPLRGGCWRSSELYIEKRAERKPVMSYNLWGFRLVNLQDGIRRHHPIKPVSPPFFGP